MGYMLLLHSSKSNAIYLNPLVTPYAGDLKRHITLAEEAVCIDSILSIMLNHRAL
jgi:hypothetical protein